MLQSTRRSAFGLATIMTSALGAALLLAAPASAEGECRTWLPDFDTGCDRESRHQNSVRPMSMPYLFEDPFVTTEAQFAYLYHEFGRRSVFGGGDLQVLALQLRLAITDRLAFIATKDGLGILRPDLEGRDVSPALTPGFDVLDDEEGFTDMTIGFKYALIDWRDKNFIFTPAIRYEIPMGNSSLFQGSGDGVFIPSGTAAWTSENGAFHVITGLGAQLPVDEDENSTSIFYNLHLDYAVELGGDDFVKAIVPFVELGGMTWVGNGDGGNNFKTNLGNLDLNTIQAATGTGSFEGYDFANLGSDDVAGNTVATATVGLRVPMDYGISLGAAYERPITNRKDIFKQRFTFMATYEY
ncbi:MAG: transporter [Myxococcota bacterium]